MFGYSRSFCSKKVCYLLLGKPYSFPLHQHFDMYAGVRLIEHHLSLCVATYILLDYR